MKKTAGFIALALVGVITIWGVTDKAQRDKATAAQEAAKAASETAQVAAQTAEQGVADATTAVSEAAVAVEAATAMVAEKQCEDPNSVSPNHAGASSS